LAAFGVGPEPAVPTPDRPGPRSVPVESLQRQPAMRTLILLSVSVLLAACGEATPPADAGEAGRFVHAFSDADVTRVHARMMSAIAPDGGWDRARYLEFDWAVYRTPDDPPVVRSHRWDRFQGRARAEYDTPDGRLVAVFDTDDPEGGTAWLDGEELEGDRAREVLRGAYRSHINDSYWLIMPYKWTDPGVHLRYLGEETDEDGRRWEVVELSFDPGTGLTPQNLYRAFVNPESGRMERWQHFSNAEAEPSTSEWVDWRRVGPIELAENRLSGGQVRIFFPHLRVETDVPEGAFRGP
jgi:hypothetical protein